MFNFNEIFFSDWDVGGCYWVVQEELLRHAAIIRIRWCSFFAWCVLSRCYNRTALSCCGKGDFHSDTLVDEILEVFPSRLPPNYIKNEVVREKYMSLRVHIFMLLVAIKQSTDSNVSMNLHIFIS